MHCYVLLCIAIYYVFLCSIIITTMYCFSLRPRCRYAYLTIVYCWILLRSPVVSPYCGSIPLGYSHALSCVFSLLFASKICGMFWMSGQIASSFHSLYLSDRWNPHFMVYSECFEHPDRWDPHCILYIFRTDEILISWIYIFRTDDILISWIYTSRTDTAVGPSCHGSRSSGQIWSSFQFLDI